MLNLLTLLDVTRPDVAASSDPQTSLVVGLMVAAGLFLWLASYLPARGARGRR